MEGLLGKDPYKYTRCGDRLRFAEARRVSTPPNYCQTGENDGFSPRNWINAPKKWVLDQKNKQNWHFHSSSIVGTRTIPVDLSFHGS